jgi:hypothetical protein
MTQRTTWFDITNNNDWSLPCCAVHFYSKANGNHHDKNKQLIGDIPAQEILYKFAEGKKLVLMGDFNLNPHGKSQAIYYVLEQFAHDLRLKDLIRSFLSLIPFFMVHSKNNIALRAELFSVEIYKKDHTKIFFTAYPIKLGAWTIPFSLTKELKKNHLRPC